MHYAPDEILIFLGPTMPLQEAKTILPATYLPPARQGDILTVAKTLKPKVIGLIDGFFLQELSVWHKEILYALNQGIHVLGASSMGALRAAETARFGMRGVGAIFDLYHRGEVIDDDEVVLVHGPAEEGYLPFSIPLINIRFTLQYAKERKRFPEELCDRFFALFQSLLFPDRTWDAVRQQALREGIAEETVSRMLTFLQTEMIDQKKMDAQALLQMISTLTPKNAPPKKIEINTPLFDALTHFDRRIALPPDNLSLHQIAHYVALHHPQYNALQFHALNQMLVDVLARILQIAPSQEAVAQEKERFFTAHRLHEGEQRTKWLECNRLSLEEFEELMSKRAATRLLHHSLCSGYVPHRQTRALLEELKLSNCYEEWEGRALLRESLVKGAAPCFSEMDHPELDGIDLITKHLRESLWMPDLPHDEWLVEAGFSSETHLKIEILKSKIAEAYLTRLCPF